MKKDGYFNEVTIEKPSGENVMSNYGRWASTNQTCNQDNVKRGSYKAQFGRNSMGKLSISTHVIQLNTMLLTTQNSSSILELAKKMLLLEP